MPKRKRSSESIESASPGPPPLTTSSASSKASLGARHQRIAYKFQQASSQLTQAFKLGKGFERQKLGRRLKLAVAGKKDASSRVTVEDSDDGDNKTVPVRGRGRIVERERVEAEIEALKQLELSRVSRWFLGKKIVAAAEAGEASAKQLIADCRIGGDGERGFFQKKSEGKEGTEEVGEKELMNVVARLCNSNPVKEALPGVLEEVLKVLGVRVAQGASLPKKKRLRKKDIEGGQGAKTMKTERKVVDEPSRQIEAAPIAESEDGFADFDDRLASDSDEYDDDTEDDEQEEGNRHQTSRPPQRYDLAADLSLSEAGSEADSPEPELRKAPGLKKSSFLPSLSLGGYISGSGSDVEDIDVAPRKNRPGQRARQQIWEKKYGTKAKHLQKQDRSQGWDMKRGATTDRGRRTGNGRMSTRGGVGRGGAVQDRLGGTTSSSNNARTIPNIKQRDDEGPIHPSWEAAKKAKEKRDAPVAFAGKKITFD